MSEKTWTKAEAEGLVGWRIVTTRPYSGVPAGTASTVTRADGSDRLGYTVGLTWDQPWRTQPLTDWFGREEFEFSIARLYDQPGDSWEQRGRVGSQPSERERGVHWMV